VIARAAITFGLVWLLMPRHPDLGLTAPVTALGESERYAVIARLREVRSEIEAQRSGQENLVWDNRWGAALQKATRLPDEAKPDNIKKSLLRAIGSRS
jgi:hypothetical protein